MFSSCGIFLHHKFNATVVISNLLGFYVSLRSNEKLFIFVLKHNSVAGSSIKYGQKTTTLIALRKIWSKYLGTLDLES